MPVLTLTVNVPFDAPDALPGDGVCEVTPGVGDCSLRAAIDEGNATVGLVEVLVPAGIYPIALPGVEDGNAGGDFDILGEVRLKGVGGLFGVSAMGIDRGFDVFGKLTLEYGEVRGGVTAGPGGGIRVNPTASLTMSFSRLEGNRSALFGGGIAVRDGTSVVNNSLLYANAARAGGGIGIAGPASVSLMTNSTLSANVADPALGGGAIPFPPGTGGGAATAVPATFIYTTFRLNVALPGAGGGLYTTSPTTFAASTLSAHGPALDCVFGLGGTVASSGYNNDVSATCFGAGLGVPTDLPGVPPMVGPLAFNGGPTETHAPLAGSPLIDTIPPGAPALCDAASLFKTDQRGFPRPVPVAGPCDRGALEIP